MSSERLWASSDVVVGSKSREWKLTEQQTSPPSRLQPCTDTFTHVLKILNASERHTKQWIRFYFEDFECNLEQTNLDICYSWWVAAVFSHKRTSIIDPKMWNRVHISSEFKIYRKWYFIIFHYQTSINIDHIFKINFFIFVILSHGCMKSSVFVLCKVSPQCSQPEWNLLIDWSVLSTLVVRVFAF